MGQYADFFRIKGVASQYAEHLELAGVDTVKELATRNATNLHAVMTAANEKKNVTKQVPAEKVVTGWIAAAQSLPPKITH